jgi:hypothetical protein
MCGRYSNAKDLTDLMKHYHGWLENQPGSELYQSALNNPQEAPLEFIRSAR